ncbi:MAG: UDP-3-O-(3-hydroxymyristoyl)glucosamine N-acyltransferase [Lentisphaeria bacterium]
MLLEKTALQIAELIAGSLTGTCAHTLQGVASLSEATERDVAFLGNEKYREQVLPSKAGVVLVPADFDQAPPEGRAWIVCPNPSDAFNAVISLFTPPPEHYSPGRHPTAVISASAQVPASVHVGAGAIIEDDVVIAENTIILPNVYIGRKCVIGSDCLLYANVVIRERCLLGNRVILHPGVVIGADGFGYKSGPAGHQKIPQVGIVQIDDDVEIGANSCVDRARFGRTWIRKGTKIDNLVQIGHNVEVGECGMIVAQVGIAGSCRLGNGVILAGQAGLAGHLQIGDGSIVMGQAGISKNLAPGSIVMGTPAVDRREFAKQLLYLGRLDKTNALLKQLQADVEALKQKNCNN